MNVWIERLGIPSLVSAIVSAVVGGGLGYLTANHVDRASKERSAKLDQIVRFTAANDSIFSEANTFIVVMASGKDLKPAQAQLRSELNKQFVQSENLKTYFNEPQLLKGIDSYQLGLVSFSTATNEATDATKIAPWVSGLDKIVVLRRQLTADLVRSVGVRL